MWGGVWGFAFVIPVLDGKMWWARGLIVGLAGLARVAFFIFRAAPPQLPFIIIGTILVLNIVLLGPRRRLLERQGPEKRVRSCL